MALKLHIHARKMIKDLNATAGRKCISICAAFFTSGHTNKKANNV